MMTCLFRYYLGGRNKKKSLVFRPHVDLFHYFPSLALLADGHSLVFCIAVAEHSLYILLCLLQAGLYYGLGWCHTYFRIASQLFPSPLYCFFNNRCPSFPIWCRIFSRYSRQGAKLWAGMLEILSKTQVLVVGKWMVRQVIAYTNSIVEVRDITAHGITFQT